MSAQAPQPYNVAKAITLSDTVNFDGTVVSTTGTFQTTTNTKPIPCEAILVGAAGNVVVVMENGLTSTMGAAAGEVLPVRAIRVNSTNTTATGCVALYLV